MLSCLKAHSCQPLHAAAAAQLPLAIAMTLLSPSLRLKPAPEPSLAHAHCTRAITRPCPGLLCASQAHVRGGTCPPVMRGRASQTAPSQVTVSDQHLQQKFLRQKAAEALGEAAEEAEVQQQMEVPWGACCPHLVARTLASPAADMAGCVCWGGRLLVVHRTGAAETPTRVQQNLRHTAGNSKHSTRTDITACTPACGAVDLYARLWWPRACPRARGGAHCRAVAACRRTDPRTSSRTSSWSTSGRRPPPP